MKRFLALAALVLGMVSCQTEPEGLDIIVGGEQEVTINVAIPEAETRADAWEDSSKGAFENVDFTKYTIRYILQVYYEGKPSKERLVKYSDGKEVAFPVRLVPDRDYQFVVWADVVVKDGKVDGVYANEDGLHYDTSDLEEITLKKTWVAMDETRDAFTGVHTETDYTGSSNITISLTRPFAKLRVVTTDMVALNNLGIMPTKATVEYKVKHYNAFNALVGSVIDDSKNRDIKHENFSIKSYGEDVQNGADMTLFTDYFFATDAQDAVQFDITVYDKKGDIIKYNIFNTDIRVQRNYITTIKGNVLTDRNNIKVEVENGGDFGGEKNVDVVEANNASDLQEAINNADADNETHIELGGDIDLGELLGAGILSTRASASSNALVTIAKGKVITLDLNGCTVTVPYVEDSTTNHFYAFENHGSLTIQDSKGNGQIIARGNFNYGTMTLKSGIINACDGNGGYGVRNYEGAEFVMDGGSIITSLEDGDTPGNGYDACPVRVDEGATATFNGGTINNISNFTCAIDNYGETTINGGTFETIHTTIMNHSTMTIDGGSFTCDGIEGITAHALWAAAGTTTINGGTFDGKDNYNGFNVDASSGAVVNIYGGEFLHVHSGSLYGEGTIIVKGGEFFDNPSKRVASGYEVVEENGVYTVAKSQAVVAFEEAIAQGGEVTLDADITLAETVVIESGKTVVLNLNGKTITGNWHKDNGAVIENNGTLTIVGGTISSTGDNGGSAVKNNGILTIENATLNGARNANGSWPSYTVNNIGTMTAENTIITSYHGAVASYGDGAVVTLNDCTIDMAGIAGFTNHGIYTYNSGKVVVNGGTYANKATDQNATGASVINGAVEVNAGTFSGRIENYYGTPVLKGGTFSVKPNAKFIAEGYTVVEKNGAYKVVSNLVAKIGNDEYTSLQSAIEAVKDGETIVLQRDIDITTPAHGQNALNHAKAVNFTLDLNGKTIYADTGNSVFRYNISQTDATSNITVTFKNGTITSGDNTWCTVMAAGTSNDVKAIFNLENLTINASKPGDLAVKAWDYAVINAKNVTVNATKCAGGFYALGGEIVLDNCTVNQKGLHTAPYLSMALAVSNKGKMTVNSGNYTAVPTAAAEGSNQGTSHGSWCAGVMNTGGELIINGGTFANGNFGDDALATAARGLIFGDTASNIVINDGTFNALKTVIDYQNNLGVQPNPNIVINGGNFSANPAVVTSYGGVVLAEGKVAAKGADGRWTLVDGVMDEAGLKAAFENGGNIVLGADITLSETVALAEGKTVNLNLNGKTLSAADKNVIRNDGGNLTIMNGTVTRTGDVVGYSVNNASGEITVENATIECGLYTSGSKMTATNANISHEQSSRHAIYAWNCEVTINSGTFHNDNAGNATLMAAGSSVVTINGGTFSIADGRSTLGWTSSMIDQKDTAKVIVKGGLFNGGFRINSADTTLTIEGGEFNTNNGSAFTDYSGTKVVRGGKFTDAGAQNWAKKYIAEGYEMNANGQVVAK